MDRSASWGIWQAGISARLTMATWWGVESLRRASKRPTAALMALTCGHRHRARSNAAMSSSTLNLQACPRFYSRVSDLQGGSVEVWVVGNVFEGDYGLDLAAAGFGHGVFPEPIQVAFFRRCDATRPVGPATTLRPARFRADRAPQPEWPT